MSPLKPKPDELLKAYHEGLAGFIGALERADATGRFDKPSHFASMLELSLTRYGLSAAALAEDEKISKGAISKWMHGQAVPSSPARKTVVGWIKRKAREQLEGVDDRQPSRSRDEHDRLRLSDRAADMHVSYA
jgi:hypothetical protein